MLEKKVEEHLCKKVKKAGGIAFKFTSPQRRSVPDRLVLLDAARAGSALYAFVNRPTGEFCFTEADYENAAMKIVASVIRFVELKATGKKPTPGQEREHARLRALGFRVDVVDNIEEIDEEYK